MILEKTKGIILNDEFISEDNYGNYGISDINDFLSKYISKYGYKLKKVFDYSKKLIVIEPINIDYLIHYGINQDLIYNYETGEVLLSPVEQNPTEKIECVTRKDRDLYYVNGHLSLFTTCIDGIYYVNDVKSNKNYPILHANNFHDDDEICIAAKDHNDGTVRMIKKLDNDSYSFLINNYNFIYFGTPKRALNFDLVYGIKYVDNEVSYICYEDRKTRDDMFLKLQSDIRNSITNGNVKIISKKK